MARIEVRVEDPGESEELEVLRVAVAPGASVAAGDLLAEVATDKVNVDVVAPASGRVAEIRVEQGDILAGNAVLVLLDVA